MLINHCIYEYHNINYPYKSSNHKRQYIPWENPPNKEDETPRNYWSMIDRFAENGLQHISKFLDKIYHHSSREERSNVTLQKQLYAIVLTFHMPSILITSQKP